MDQQNTFQYTYSAQENQEVLAIRKKYLPRQESKLEELKRLDKLVQGAGVVEALCAGIGGCLIFGTGFCLAMGVIGNARWLGVILGLLGTVGMLIAFPMYRKLFRKAKKQYGPQILALAEEISGQAS